MSFAGGGDKVLVTGATGLLGSHLAERLVAQGDRVRALVRQRQPHRIPRRPRRRDHSRRPDRPGRVCRCVIRNGRVFHCAAKVGDWGTWPEFQTGCIDATSLLAQAAARAGVDRFVHISSTSAYGHPPDQATPIDETARTGPERVDARLLHAQQGRLRARPLADGGNRHAPLDRHPPELALRRARSHDRSAVHPRIRPRPDVDRGQGRQSP